MRVGGWAVAAVIAVSLGLAACAGTPEHKSVGPPPTSPAPPPVIGAAGDIACDPKDPAAGDPDEGPAKPVTDKLCQERQTARLLGERPLAAVLVLGDLQYNNGTLDKFRASYDKSWGGLDGIARPVPGNHEYDTPAAAGYFDYWAQHGTDPSGGSWRGPDGKGWYSFDVGAWHLVAINSNCGDVGGCGPASEQGKWLAADLAAHPAKCTIAYFHHPRFTSVQGYSNKSLEGIWTVLYDHGVELALNGHAHNYERFAPMTPAGRPDPAHGVRQIIVGTGGKSLYDFGGKPLPGSQVRERTYGALFLTLKPTSYDWQFVDINGKVLDSGDDRLSLSACGVGEIDAVAGLRTGRGLPVADGLATHAPKTCPMR